MMLTVWNEGYYEADAKLLQACSSFITGQNLL